MSDSNNIDKDEIVLLKQRIQDHPVDILGYLELIKVLEKSDNFAESREVYDQLHKRFPFYSPLWTIQLKNELQRDEFETVEKLLAQCLSGDLENNDLALWSTYLDYVRRKNNIITGGQEARAIVIKAFDLVLEKCATFEPRSSQFWNDYLGFLETWKPVNKWEEQQRIDLIRSLYKKMLCVPFDNLEKMWSRYTQWEQDTNNLTARKFIGEISSEYMKARSCYQEWLNLTSNLRRVSPNSLNSANKKNIPQYDNESIAFDQLKIWRNWIKWEKENKLLLSDDLLRKRILYIYRQGIQNLLFVPEIWYQYSMYDNEILQRQQILSIAVLANPNSATLTFKLAECFESNNNNEKVQETFENCTKCLINDYNKILEECANDNDHPTVYRVRHELTFVYCIYMNTMKRLSGLSAARVVFGKCRKWKGILTHIIYIENAYLEFQNQFDYKTAFKVLELGLKFFQNDGKYINKYLDFLILLNRDSQIKTLFESSVEKVNDLTQLKSIFKKMIAYESKFGNLGNVYALEERYFKKFPNEKLIETFTERYTIQNENVLKKLELTYLQQENRFNNEHELDTSQFNPMKRSLENDQNDNHEKKMKSNPSIPPEIFDLLTVLPKRQYFKTALLDPHKFINYLNDQVELPSSSDKV
ncbi:hypothetical protein Kpol_1019p9 [Vanderwaltozyma polyspora DSM 70294]|uniref:mRNA 3'-end-processing protein RNA14 n=1 Tax=Vanderwaltozyma polyspora (strain ATCC 22028 / DSM 70294 / BCRC 21397 / CBS 2163 / NBRC 10782 / NRRL Y-8283 / UCD 57-17) TaxID=436907 RepID=A7TPA2_VANPO|nr:uncharacterized protein Kpol_1019p9 [Vanderwaltozyma polyspora DSM 70294]EDO15889.1 hypothetical protein Kpol_1019p9 [Vanderwaltozyma polyspora DSM 70294]